MSTTNRAMVSRLFVYIVIVTSILARWDWQAIHDRWWNYGQWPNYAANYSAYMQARQWAGIVLCPICLPLAENYYFVLMEIEAGTEEQNSVLPVPYSGNPLFPDGARYWWGQGEGREWRPVSMLALYLYWLPTSVIWWLMVGDLFWIRRPWWMPKKRHWPGRDAVQVDRLSVEGEGGEITNNTVVRTIERC